MAHKKKSTPARPSMSGGRFHGRFAHCCKVVLPSSQSARLRRGLVMSTVWLFEPRSHGRNRTATPLPGRTPSVALTPSTGVSGFAPVWALSIFSSSCVVIRPWCLESAALLLATGGGAGRAGAARAAQCGARAAGRPMCNPPERGARAPVCKAARGGHRQVHGCARRAPLVVRRGLRWPGACGVLQL